jgi:membrane-bound lytic murein transglycosylase F
MIKHIPLIAVIISIVFMQGDVLAKERAWTKKFDPHFRKYAKRYFGPNVDWRWFKAQGIAESALKDTAKSHAGAKGLMQILPSTFAEIRGKNPQFTNIDEPRWNIAAGIYYDRQLYKKMTDLRSFQNRLYLTFAGYNAGYGGVLNAIKRSRATRDNIEWKNLKIHLPKETRGYVGRIISLKKGDLARQ